MGALVVGCHCLQPEEQLLVESCTEYSTINGPQFCMVGFGKSSTLRNAVHLSDKEYCRIESTLDGRRRSEVGPKLVFLGAYDRLIQKSEARTLGPNEYIHVTDERTGDYKTVRGPMLFFPGTYDTLSQTYQAIALQHNMYIKIVDSISGSIRVPAGEQLVYMEPTEERMDVAPSDVIPGVKRAVELDFETAVLIRDTQSGQLQLKKGNKLFFPKPTQEIIEVRKLITLADHESMIIVDRFGHYHFYSGALNFGTADMQTASDTIQRSADDTDEEDGFTPPERSLTVGPAGSEELNRAFFLEPYFEIVTLMWSSGIEKEERNDRVVRIDKRPQFMNYEFICRTNDNVELILDITFFWQVISVPDMISFTDDAPGDICHHARSIIIQHVSQVSLEKFMADFNPIVQHAILGTDDKFYEQRGTVIHTVEVRELRCRDQATERVLQAIIQETTNKMNRMVEQESKNEVAIFKIKGDIEEERMNGELLKIKHDHHREEFLMEGQAESDRVNAFMTGLADSVPDVAQRVQLFNTLRKVEALKALSNGNSTLYFTPSDVDLSIETVQMDGHPKRRSGRPQLDHPDI